MERNTIHTTTWREDLMPADNLKLLTTLYRTEGLWAVVKRLAFRFYRVHRFLIFRLRLSGELEKGVIPEGIEFKEAGLDELRTLRADRPDLPEYFFRDESDSTLARCWIGLWQGKLCFIAWISFTGSSGLVKIGQTEAEMAYIFCLKEMRGKRLTRHAVLRIGETLFAEGITSLLAVPHSRNPAIIKSFIGSGFVKIGTINRFAFVTWPRTPVDTSKLKDPASE